MTTTETVVTRTKPLLVFIDRDEAKVLKELISGSLNIEIWSDEDRERLARVRWKLRQALEAVP